MKDKKNEISGKTSARVAASRGQKYRRDLKTRGETGVQNIPLQRCEDFDTAYRQKEHKNLVVRTVRNQEHPMAQRGLLGFPMEQINTGKTKHNSKRHRITHNQKYNLLLEALERKSTVLSKRSKRSG
ncbi:hypothetical protein Zmor_004338 [Zophobas morio]|uniref:Uncharacterized protein n=1 Tax=Zophobas morio TaxID=2755281 RepID=A0AA38HJR8_9CUCU|nr:hypothetical protein Zmor_004338 [Zophobas morio]